MATKAYILVEIEAGRADDVIGQASGIPGVTSVDTVTGPYDVIAVVETDDPGAIGSVIRNFQIIPGVRRTVTCLAFS